MAINWKTHCEDNPSTYYILLVIHVNAPTGYLGHQVDTKLSIILNFLTLKPIKLKLRRDQTIYKANLYVLFNVEFLRSFGHIAVRS